MRPHASACVGAASAAELTDMLRAPYSPPGIKKPHVRTLSETTLSLKLPSCTIVRRNLLPTLRLAIAILLFGLDSLGSRARVLDFTKPRTWTVVGEMDVLGRPCWGDGQGASHEEIRSHILEKEFSWSQKRKARPATATRLARAAATTILNARLLPHLSASPARPWL